MAEEKLRKHLRTKIYNCGDMKDFKIQIYIIKKTYEAKFLKPHV